MYGVMATNGTPVFDLLGTRVDPPVTMGLARVAKRKLAVPATVEQVLPRSM